MFALSECKDNVLANNVALTAGATNAVTYDMLGAKAAKINFIVSLGTGATLASANGTTVSLLQSDNTNTSTFTTISGSTQSALKNSCNCLFFVNMLGKDRYLRVSTVAGTSGATNENATVTVLGSQGRLEQDPASLAALVTGANDPTPIIV